MPGILNPPLIAILTDMGQSDWFVGTMKGVALSTCPIARLVDICHEVSEQDVETGAFVLKMCYRFFPDGTIFLCVVDPEVGTARQAIVARNERYHFVAPNNGLLTFPAEESEQWEVRAVENVSLLLGEPSQTFHGRDIFAPAAGHLALGTSFEEFGPPLDDFFKLPYIENVRLEENRLRGRIVYIDHFGNLLSNVTANMLPEGVDPAQCTLSYKERIIHGISPHYAAVPLNPPLMYWGSSGLLEIGLNRESAARKWNVSTGEWFELKW